MSTVLPKLRSDLLFSQRGREGQTVFVVKDPRNHQFFRLNEADYCIASQLDGRTPLETIRRRVEGQLDVSLSAQALDHFVGNLRRFKLLEHESGERARPRRRRRLRGSLLYLRFRVFDPDAMFQRLVVPLRFCFTPAFVAGSAAMILWASGLAVANWDGLRQDLTQLLRWDVLLVLLATVCAVTTMHEFAHGLTCKHFGGEVRELGFLLMYFQPAFYTNVSDARLFPEKWKRFWVGFAGPYFELLIWAGAVLVWRVTDPETWLNFGALAVIATSGIKTLMNFNPLLKLDGYYLLSDLLDVPNLRRQAYRFIGDRIKRLVGMARRTRDQIPRRERRIYLGYGLVSAVFSFLVLGFVLVKLGGFLIANRQPEALILAGGLLVMKARGRFRRLFGHASKSSDVEDPPMEDVLPEPNGAAEETKPRVSKDRPRPFPKRLVVGALSVIIGLPVLFLVPMQLRIAGPFTVLPVENTDVRPEVGGTVEQIFVDEGDRVQEGDVIARLSDRDNRAALQRTEAELAQLQAQLKLLQAGTRPEEIQLDRLAVTRAESRREFARKNLDRDEQLLRAKLLSEKECDVTRLAVKDADADLADARSRLQEALAGSRPEEIEAAKAGVARLDYDRCFFEMQLAQIQVLSPAAGIVATPSHELKEMVGQVVKEGDLIAKVYEMKTVEVETPVSEKDIADIQVGNKVALKVRAFPEKTFFGTVTSVGVTAQISQPGAGDGTSGNPGPSPAAHSSSTPTILVTTRIANDDLLLKPGMTGMVKIYCGDRRVFDLLTRRAARTVKVEFWSWW